MSGGRLFDLFRHLEWADARLWEATLAHPPARADEDFVELLVHQHMVQHAFLAVWRREEVQVRESDDFESLEAVLAWARDYHVALRGWLEAVDEAEVAERRVELPWAHHFAVGGGEAGPTTLEETMHQVVLHSSHHRGQLNRRLRELGGEPRTVDYIVWLWRGRPAPEWPGE